MKGIVIGLTGQTGAGKTVVAGMLRKRGNDVVDADQVSREVVEKYPSCLGDIALKFTCLILNADGTLNRKKLGAIVFSDKKKLAALNKIIFPYILQEIDQKVEKLTNEKGESGTIIVLDAPTLFESGCDRYCKKVISVLAPKDLRLGRIVKRDNLTLGEAGKRMDSQNEESFFVDHSDYLIQNGGNLVALEQQVSEVWSRLTADLDAERVQLMQQEQSAQGTVASEA